MAALFSALWRGREVLVDRSGIMAPLPGYSNRLWIFWSDSASTPVVELGASGCAGPMPLDSYHLTTSGLPQCSPDTITWSLDFLHRPPGENSINYGTSVTLVPVAIISLVINLLTVILDLCISLTGLDNLCLLLREGSVLDILLNIFSLIC